MCEASLTRGGGELGADLLSCWSPSWSALVKDLALRHGTHSTCLSTRL